MPKVDGRYKKKAPEHKPKFEITRRFVADGHEYIVKGADMYEATRLMLEKLAEMGLDASRVTSCETI